MTSFMPNEKPKQGEVYLTAVTFRDDPSTRKVRPIVIVSNDRATDIDVVAISVSSQQPRSEFDVIIEYWKEAGLSKPSVARTSKLFSVSMDQLQRQLGELHFFDLQRVIQKCKDVF